MLGHMESIFELDFMLLLKLLLATDLFKTSYASTQSGQDVFLRMKYTRQAFLSLTNMLGLYSTVLQKARIVARRAAVLLLIAVLVILDTILVMVMLMLMTMTVMVMVLVIAIVVGFFGLVVVAALGQLLHKQRFLSRGRRSLSRKG